MKGRQLLILAVVAVILVVGAVVTSRKDARPAPEAVGKLVLPDLPVNTVEKIVVRSAAGTATVVCLDNAWVMPDRFRYPADFNKVKDTLLKVSELKIGDVMRVDDAQRARLKLLPPKAGEPNAGTVVEFLGPGDTMLASLLVGEPRMRKGNDFMPGGYPDGHYLSPDGGKTVFLVNATLTDLPVDSAAWLDTELCSVTSFDLNEITLSGPDRPDLRLVRTNEAASLEVVGLATNETTESSKQYSVEGALASLRFDDVADPSLTIEQTGLDKPALYRAVTKKGEIYTVRIGGKKEGTDRRFVKIEAALKDAPEKPRDAAAGDKDKPDEAAAKERKEREDKVKAFNEKVGKWTYLLSSGKTDYMTIKRDGLVKKKEEEKKPSDPDAGDAAGKDKADKASP